MSRHVGLGLGAGVLLLLSSAPVHADDRLTCASFVNDFRGHGTWEVQDLGDLALLLAETPRACPDLRRDIQTRITQLGAAARARTSVGGGDRPNAGGGGAGGGAGQMMNIHDSRNDAIRVSDRESNGFRYDQFPLNVRPGDLITVVMESSAVLPYVVVGQGSLPDAFISVGEQRGNEGDTQVVLNLEVPPYAPDAPEQFYLVATSGNQTLFGAYSVSVSRWDRPPPPPPQPIAFGTSVHSSITETSARSATGYLYEPWVFDGLAGQTVRISMNAEYDNYLEFGQMVDNQFVELTRNDDGGAGLNAQITYQLPADGQYVIYARPYGSYAAGDYDLLVEVLQPRAIEAEAVPNEANSWIISGALDATAGLDEQLNYYRDYDFRTRRGGRYSATVTSGEFDPILDLGLRQRGRGITPVDFYNAESPQRSQRTILFEADSSNYVLRTRTFEGGGSGSYQIIVTALTEAEWQTALEERRRAQEEAAAAAAAYEEPAAEPPADAEPPAGDPAAPPAQ
jgi:hypothetical protein